MDKELGSLPNSEQQGQKPLLPSADVFKKPAELRRSAEATAKALIEDPIRLINYLQEYEARMTELELAGNQSERDQLLAFASGVNKRIDREPWNQRQAPLSTQSARAILLHLPKPEELKKRQVPLHQRCVEKLAVGFFNRRFEKAKGTAADWRGAVDTLYTTLEGAIGDRGDLEMLETFFNLMMGKYPTIISQFHSPAWRAHFLGNRAVGPADEHYLAKALEIDRSLKLVAHLLNRTSELQANSREYTATLSIPFAAAIDIYKSNLDPTKGNGRKIFEAALRAYGANQKSVSPEVFAVAQAAALNYERYQALAHFIDSQYQIGQGTSELPAGALRLGAAEARDQFPNYLLFRPSPQLEKIHDLFEAGAWRASLQKTVQDLLHARGPDWQSRRFAIKDLQGYAILPTQAGRTQTAEIEVINQFLENPRVQELCQEFRSAPRTISSIVLTGETADIVLSRPGLVETSAVDTLLDMLIPEDKRQQAYAILKESIDYSRGIHPHIKRMPSTGGDLYDLINDPKLPRVIEHLIIRKKPDQGLVFEITLAGNSQIMGDQIPRLRGAITFDYNRVNVLWDRDNPAIAADHSWILGRVILSAVKKSCSPKDEELDEEFAAYKGETEALEWGEKPAHAIPGCRVHIGGIKASGAPGEPTQYATANLANDLTGGDIDAAGHLLYLWNQQHRQSDPKDQRMLTYRKGYDLEGDTPKLRGNPEDTLPELGPGTTS